MTIIGKQLVCQKYIYKIHSSRLRKERWKLTLPIEEARRNDEVISLADSQMLRWIDELNGITDADAKANEIKTQIRRLRKEERAMASSIRIGIAQFKPTTLPYYRQERLLPGCVVSVSMAFATSVCSVRRGSDSRLCSSANGSP